MLHVGHFLNFLTRTAVTYQSKAIFFLYSTVLQMLELFINVT